MGTHLTDIHFSTLLPIYRQLYQHIKKAIYDGLLISGQRLPSTRNLATQLNIARGTVDRTYDILINEGLLITDQQRGTFVANLSLTIHTKNKPNSPLSLIQSRTGLLDFQLGIPAVDQFPLAQWNRLLGNISRSINHNQLSYPDPQGEYLLRNAIAGYLRLSRGIDCQPAQIVITAGYSSAISLITSIALSPNTPVALENPGYPPSRLLLSSLGFQTLPIAVDQQGIDILKLQQSVADAVVITPAHQSPTGVTLSLERRLQLIDWASKEDKWIIEDDYDGEYRYTGYPLPCLKSLDTQQRVFYVGSFSKVLFPALRLGYIVIPPQLTNSVQQYFQFHSGLCPTLIQSTVAKFIELGYFFRHLKKMRQLYFKRRQLLINALELYCPLISYISCHEGGMHLIVLLPAHIEDKVIAQKGEQQQLSIEALSNWYFPTTAAGEKMNGLILGFTNISNKEMAKIQCQKLHQLLTEYLNYT
nr:PLP-dependent aminotransferase family protein [uncultured Moellerella sp.]